MVSPLFLFSKFCIWIWDHWCRICRSCSVAAHNTTLKQIIPIKTVHILIVSFDVFILKCRQKLFYMNNGDKVCLQFGQQRINITRYIRRRVVPKHKKYTRSTQGKHKEYTDFVYTNNFYRNIQFYNTQALYQRSNNYSEVYGLFVSLSYCWCVFSYSNAQLQQK